MTSVLSEAESIIAKYSAMKPNISRPSIASSVDRFGVTQLPHVSATAQGSSNALYPDVLAFQPSSSSEALLRSSTMQVPPLGEEASVVMHTPVSPKRTVRSLPLSSSLPAGGSSATPLGSRTMETTAQDGMNETPSFVGLPSSLTAVRDTNLALQELQHGYSTNLRFFAEVAREQDAERELMRRENSKMKEVVARSDVLLQNAANDTEAKVAATQEECARQILKMRKTLLLSEQSAGSLRTENETLYLKATDNELLREEVEQLKSKLDDADKKLVILAQQNSALQRALKQKEADCQADLDVYVKQLDVVQCQNQTMKRELEIMTINARQQSNLEKELERLNGKNQTLQDTIQTMNQEIAAMEDRLQKILGEKDEECAREVLKHRRLAMALETKCGTLETQLEAVVRRQKPSAQQAEIADLKQRIETLSAVLVEQERHKMSLVSNMDKLKDELLHERNLVAELRQLYSQAVSELGQARAGQ